MRFKCITKVTEKNKTYRPGEIIPDISPERAASLERSLAGTVIEEELPKNPTGEDGQGEKDEKPKVNSRMTVPELKAIAKKAGIEDFEEMTKPQLLKALKSPESDNPEPEDDLEDIEDQDDNEDPEGEDPEGDDNGGDDNSQDEAE